MNCLYQNTHGIFSGIVAANPLTPIIRLLRHFGAFLILCAFEATSGVLLFGSKPILDRFRLAVVTQKYRSFFSLVFLLVSFLVILWLVDFFDRTVLDKWEDR
jgi:hypothetical protein